MDTRGLLDQILGAGRQVLNQTGMTNDNGQVSDLGKGVAAGGLTGLLLGSSGGRKLAAYGGLAALGVMAYRAYANRDVTASDMPVQRTGQAAVTEGRLVLKALLAGARADGHIDARERALIDEEINRLGGDPTLRQWVEQELASPLDPNAFAAEVGNDPVLASEVYLATALVVADAGFMERAYLDQLAQSLKLDPAVKQRLESEVAAA